MSLSDSSPALPAPGPTDGRPEPGSPADVIRGLVLALGQVSDAEADLLLRVLEQLHRIEQRDGRDAARQAARRVRAVWLEGQA